MGGGACPGPSPAPIPELGGACCCTPGVAGALVGVLVDAFDWVGAGWLAVEEDFDFVEGFWLGEADSLPKVTGAGGGTLETGGWGGTVEGDCC